VNPIGFDSEDPQGLAGIPGVRLSEDFIRGQLEILESLRRMGAETVLTCTPYYTPQVSHLGLKHGDSVAWGESSAIAYANSVLGLRTNREGGPLALLAAIAGRTYYWGLHKEENRVPRILFRVDQRVPVDDALAGILGAEVARRAGDRVPAVDARLPDELSLREFLAALGTAGAIGMAHILGVSRDPYFPDMIEDVVEYGRDEVNRLVEEYLPPAPPEIIFVGCPHAKAEDLARLLGLLRRYEKRGERKAKTIVFTTSRAEMARAASQGLLAEAERLGVTIIPDTCLIVSPFGRGSEKPTVATNSYKAYFYLAKRGVPVGLQPLEALVDLAYS